MCGEKNTEKNSYFQMGIESTTVRTLVSLPRRRFKGARFSSLPRRDEKRAP